MSDECGFSPDGRHCQHRRANPEAACCYCTVELGEEMDLPPDAVESIKRVALERAREEGCTCPDPDVELKPLVGALGVKLVATEIGHDNDCALWQVLDRASKARFN